MKPDYINIHTHKPTRKAEEPTFWGIHPWETGRDDAEVLLAQLERRLAAESQGADNNSDSVPLDMIGETGLDHACDKDRTRQLELFRRHLDLAEKYDMPVVLHTVKSFEETIKELKGRRLKAVIFHGFTGSTQQARRAVDEGFYLSFGRRSLSSPKTVRAMQETPLSRMFFETDNDDVPIEEIYARANALLGTEPEELQRRIRMNYEEIFRK